MLRTRNLLAVEPLPPRTDSRAKGRVSNQDAGRRPVTRPPESRETASAPVGHDADHPILVTGATGQEGGAVLRHLRRQGFAVRALTRDGHSPAARALAATGVAVIQGDFDDRASLERALDGAYGAYAVQTPWQRGGVAGQVRQGIALAGAAPAAGVQHLGYSSVRRADRQTGRSHLESKNQNDAHIRPPGPPS